MGSEAAKLAGGVGVIRLRKLKKHRMSTKKYCLMVSKQIG
jgi:hypothetical protein